MTITLERISTVCPLGGRIAYSEWGYCINSDGTVYSLGYRFYHGVVLALLYPDALKAHRSNRIIEELVMPDDREDISVFDFQDFELSQHGKLPVIRICGSRLMSEPSFDFPKAGCTIQQIEALRRVLKLMGLRGTDKVSTELRDMKVSDLWDYIANLGVENG